MEENLHLNKINENFNLKLKEFENNNFRLINEQEYFDCGYPTDNLTKAEIPYKPIILLQNTLRKAIGLIETKKDDAHQLTIDKFIDFPKILNNPIIIVKGSTDNSRLLFTEIKDKTNRTVIAPIQLKFEINHIKLINVASVYTKPNDSLINLLISAVSKCEVYYCDVNKIKIWLKEVRQLQLLPKILSQISGTKIQKSDTKSQEKNEKNTLGAVEILSQNGKKLDFKGFKPSYKLLNDYSHLIDHTDNLYTLKGNGLADTLDEIRTVAIKYHSQVSRLAKHLFATSKEQAAFNVWHWIVTNLKYNFDKQGREEIRTPARSFKDGTNGIGIDCEDMAIFAVCLLYQMGYNPKFCVVAFNGKTEPGHIYAMLTNARSGTYYNLVPGIVVDAVMTKFNTHPDYVTKSIIMEGIPVYTLSGTTIEDILVQDIAGAINKPDGITRRLLCSRHIYRKKGVNGLGATSDDADVRKMETLIMLNGLEQRDVLLGAMPYINDITPKGEFVFDNPAIASLVENYFNEVDGQFDALDSLGDIADIAAKKKSVIKKATEKLQKATTVVKKAVTDTVKKATNTKVVKNIIKYNPLTIAARGGLRIVLALNIFNLAYKLAPAYLSEKEAIDEGYDITEWKKLKETLKRIEELFATIGGNPEILKKDILSGASKKQKKLEKKQTLSGIGEAVTVSTSVAASSTLWMKIKDWLKNIDFTKLFANLKKLRNNKKAIDEAASDEGTNPDTVNLGPETSLEVINITNENKAAFNQANANTEEESSGGWLLPVSIVASLLIAFFAFK